MEKEKLFSNIKFNCIGDVDQKIKNDLINNGAKEEKLLSGSTTHAIVTDYENMEAEEARDLWQIPTITSKWVELSLKCGQLLPAKAFQPSSEQLFFGLVICPSQLSRSDCCRLWSLVTYHGGSVELTLSNKCTHLVVPTPNGKKYEVASTHNENITCVTLDWITNSVKDGKLKDIVKYHPSLVILPPKTTPAVPTSAQAKKDMSSFSRSVQPKDIVPNDDQMYLKAKLSAQENTDVLDPPLNPSSIQKSMLSAAQLSIQNIKPNVKHKDALAVNLTPPKNSDIAMASSNESSSLLPPTEMTQSSATMLTKSEKKTPAKKRRNSKPKTSTPQSTLTAAQIHTVISASSVNPTMSPIRPPMQQQLMGQNQQSQFMTPGQFNSPQQASAAQMKMMPLVGGQNVQMGFHQNYPNNGTSPQIQQAQRQFMRPQMVQLNQQQMQQQMFQMPHGSGGNLNQFLTQQQMNPQQIMNQQQMQMQNPRQPGGMYIHQQMVNGSGMLSPRQPTPTTPQQQFITQQQQQNAIKQPHHPMIMHRMMSANKMPHQQNANTTPQQIQNHSTSTLQQTVTSLQSGMEAISPTALQQGLLIAQQNQRQQQQPLIHPSLQTPMEVPGSPGNGGGKKRPKARKGKEGETKPRARAKTTKKKAVPLQSPMTPQPLSQKENTMVDSPMYSTGMMIPQTPRGKTTVDQQMFMQQTLQMQGKVQPQPHNVINAENIPTQPNATTPQMPMPPDTPPVSLPPLREPFEDPLQAVPEIYEGKYHGHDPAENVPSDLCLLGCVFVIEEYEQALPDAEILQQWKAIIKKFGGIVETEYNSATCTHLMCMSQSLPLFRQALLDGKRCVSVYWLNDILLVRKLRPPWLLLHIPTPFSPKDKPLKHHLITYTGFHQKERERLKRMLSVAGAKFTDNMSRSNTVLICKFTISLKSEKAREWKIPCVNIDWLKKVVEGEPIDINDEKFSKFPDNPTKLFTLDDENMKQILDPWKVPVRVTLDCMQRAHVKRKSNGGSLPPMKRARIEESYQPLPRVCFTAIPTKQVEELTKKLESLGGQLCENIKFATHLVTNRVCRTMKFLSAVSTCQYIITPEWIEDSSKSNWLLDEDKYGLNDQVAEKRFNFTLFESIKRAQEKPLFQNHLFYITENVLPNKKCLTPIIKCAGGKVLDSVPSVVDLKRIQRRMETNNKIVIIACPHDEELVIKWKLGGIVCHSAEFILSCVLRQEIDETSFRL